MGLFCKVYSMAVRIKILPENLANKIAAGEVVERPASVVKELAENSLDAGARRVTVDIQAGGTKLISVSDDGCGMNNDEALLCLERHATSKIKSTADLSAIGTLGFRGEALPSVASVSRMRLTTSDGNGKAGTLLVVEGGKLVMVKETGAPKGTTVDIRDLFFNTPARLKFLKSIETEFGHIAASIEKMALAHPDIHFRLTHNGREVLDCPPVKYLKDRVAQVYGTDFAKGLIEIDHTRGSYRVTGFVSAPGVSFSDKSRQDVYVNGRPVKNPTITRALYDACQSLIMKDRHPASIIFLDMDPASVDVNVHPAKREVRFAENSEVHRAVFEAVTDAYKAKDIDLSATAPEGMHPWKDRVREAVDTYMSTTEGKRDFWPRSEYAPRQESLVLPRGKSAPSDPERHEHAVSPAAPQYPQALQVADSYIIIPADDGYMVIDQHAAHERVQYEKVKAGYGKKGPGSQGLLVPEKLDLSAKEAALMEGILPELNAIGIEAESFGGGSFLIRSRPLFLGNSDIKEVVLGILSDMDESDVKGKVEDLREKVYQLMACKSAVKAGQRLHPEAINRLIRQLFDCEMPYTCAHGRPTVVKFGMGELEKMFKRK